MVSDDETALSASSVNTFLRCAYQWELAYVYKVKRPPSVRQILGIAAHEAVEVNYRQKIDTYEDLPVEDVQDAFATAYKNLVIDVEDPEEDTSKAKDSGALVISEYQKTVAPQVQPLFVEEPISFEIEGVPYSGVVDVVDHDERIRDLKTTARKPSGRGDYGLNMVGYALGYRTVHGGQEQDLILDYMVRTKEPYHYPVSNGGPTPPEAIKAFADILTTVSGSIKLGSFPPTGLSSGACSWCGYAQMCKYYKVTGK
jgi:RecB family exonuclease